jgi:transposase
MPIDDSVVENAPRPVAMGRTSYLHLGSDRGGRTAPVLYLYSLTGTCKHHDIDPLAWL